MLWRVRTQLLREGMRFLRLKLIYCVPPLCGLALGCASVVPGINGNGAEPFFRVGSLSQYTLIDCSIPLATEMRFENFSADAASLDAPFDPDRPTIVLIHGRNILADILGCGTYGWPREMGPELARRLGNRANIVVFNHDVLAAVPVPVYEAAFDEIADFMVAELIARGLNHDLQLIAHSGGVEVAARAVPKLGHVQQVTVLDGGTSTLNTINAAPEAFFNHVGYTDNYIVPFPFGLGTELVGSENVLNVRLLTNFDDFPVAGHNVVTVWYMLTVRHPEAPGGFNDSVLEGTPRFSEQTLFEFNSFLYEPAPDGTLMLITP